MRPYYKRSSLQEVADLAQQKSVLPLGLIGAGAGGLAGLGLGSLVGKAIGRRVSPVTHTLMALGAAGSGASVGVDWANRNAIADARDQVIGRMSDDDLSRARSLMALEHAYTTGRMGVDATDRYERMYEELPVDPYDGPINARGARAAMLGAQALGAAGLVGAINPFGAQGVRRAAAPLAAALGVTGIGLMRDPSGRLPKGDRDHMRKMGPMVIGGGPGNRVAPPLRSTQTAFDAADNEFNLRNALRGLSKQSSAPLLRRGADYLYWG
jgi:hypothetical protein